MGGLIAGFLEGAGNATAEIGKMAFADKLSNERAEAKHLRDTVLKRGEGEYSEMSDRQFEIEKLEKSGEISAKSKAKDSRTTNQKNADALIARGYPRDTAIGLAHGAMKQIKDEETGQMTVVNTLGGKEVGRLTDQGWLQTGELPPKAEVTSKHRKAAKKAGSEKAGYLSTDVTDFPETEGDRKAWEREEAQRLANKERGDSSGGIVDSVAGKAKPSAKRQLTAEQYRKGMKKKFENITDTEIDKMLEKAREAGRISG